LKIGKELKNAINAYEDLIADAVEAKDCDGSKSNRRAGLEYPVGLKEEAQSSPLTLIDLLSSDTDLSSMKTVWLSSTDSFFAEITRLLGNQKILEPADWKSRKAISKNVS